MAPQLAPTRLHYMLKFHSREVTSSGHGAPMTPHPTHFVRRLATLVGALTMPHPPPTGYTPQATQLTGSMPTRSMHKPRSQPSALTAYMEADMHPPVGHCWRLVKTGFARTIHLMIGIEPINKQLPLQGIRRQQCPQSRN